ncbi:zinc finger CCCH domain-containing protein [Musa troglodytarum]|uniref:Zinc finger CCCH domain-containing protein n=1 Tax=Musa troglodytarum TaxID=320322 RepID=A0A9E7K2X9_9LILI|nr:zinc finger CCCH domain-containing protein [Musa troglodytarum]
MDAYEATRIVFSRIQNLDPDNAAKIMGLLLLQEHGEKEMIRLAFGPETQLHSVVLKARKEIGLVPVPTSSAPGTPSAAAAAPASPFLLRQNSASRLLSGGLPSPLAVSSPSSWAPPSVFSRSSCGTGLNASLDELQNSDELISPSNVSVSPFYAGGGGDLVDEFHLPDQLSFLGDPAAALDSSHAVSIASKLGGDMFHPDIECRSPSGNGDGALFPYGVGWGINGYHHRRSCSAADLCLGDPAAGFGWKPCLYFARGYCKNGTACRFLHGLPEEAAAVAAGAKMDGVVEQQFQELLLRSKSQRIGSASQLMASAFPYSPTGSVPPSPSSSSSKCLSFLLQQQQNESQRAAAAAAAAALMLGGDEAYKFLGRSRLERGDLMANPGSRQIYLTFPADSTFREEDVSNYFSIYGPVQDVRIPYQQKRMFGFVTFVYPETVKLILAKGNPHFVCDSRVLVKPYKEKGKVPDKYRKQQHAERSDFSACTTPTALDARDAYDLQQLGARMLYSGGGGGQELLLRRKLEEQHQQAAELQRAIELQGRRIMGLHLDLSNRGLSSSAPASINSPTIAAAQSVGNADGSSNVSNSSSSSQEGSPTEDKKSLSAAAPEEKVNSGHGLLQHKAEQEESAREANPNEDGGFQESAEHNLPDSPFASPPTKSPFMPDSFSAGEDASTSCTTNNSSSSSSSNNNSHLIASTLLPTTSSLDVPAFGSCFFQMPRYHGKR